MKAHGRIGCLFSAAGAGITDLLVDESSEVERTATVTHLALNTQETRTVCGRAVYGVLSRFGLWSEARMASTCCLRRDGENLRVGFVSCEHLALARGRYWVAYRL